MEATVARLRASFKAGKSRSYEWRIQQLKGIQRFIQENEKLFEEALKADLGKPQFEAVGLELIPLKSELKLHMSQLAKWMQPEQTPSPAFMAPASSELVTEPYGVCLVVGAFNYPLCLTLNPLIGAISGGNCIVIKPSEMAPSCEKLIAELLPKYLDKDCFGIVTGDYKVSAQLVTFKWDKIFFTGSPRVGKLVLKAAAEHLTPVILELGGKSPTIVDSSCTNLDLAVKRIAWGKCSNSGQTCISPDYILCHEALYDAFVEKYCQTLKNFFGEDPQKSPDYGRIVSTAHCSRLEKLLNDSTFPKGPGKIVHGGKVDTKNRFIEPTVVTGMTMDSPLMTEEIFGPILPVIKFKNVEEVVETVQNGEIPLTIYIFGKNRAFIDIVTNRLQSGSVVVNDTMYQYGNNHAPFGGIGNSGMGSYFGKASFECFSHKKSILRRDDHTLLDIPVRYPPYHPYAISIFNVAVSLPAIPPTNTLKKGAFLVSVVGLAVLAVVNGAHDARSFGLLICSAARFMTGR